MPTEDSREFQPGRGRWERSQQSVHWRDIGISAVAAAARYANAPMPVAPATRDTVPKSEAATPKIVTLRDIEYFTV